jgi:hypothetical protein
MNSLLSAGFIESQRINTARREFVAENYLRRRRDAERLSGWESAEGFDAKMKKG